MTDVDEPHGVPGPRGRTGKTGAAGSDVFGRATALTFALEENSAALGRVLRRQRITMAVTALLAALMLITGYLYVEVRQAQNAACESGNNVRSGLLRVADTLEAAYAAPRPDGRERTPVEVERERDFVADLRTDFALRDCG